MLIGEIPTSVLLVLQPSRSVMKQAAMTRMLRGEDTTSPSGGVFFFSYLLTGV